MKRFIATSVAMVLLASTALAQPYGNGGHGGYDHGPPPGHGGYDHGPPPGYGGYDHGPPRREAHEWRRGEHYDGHGEWVDWRREHLREPPRGYEWVDTGGQFVMIAIATGIITDVLLRAAQ